MKFLFNHITFLQDAPSNELILGTVLEPEPIPYSFNTLGWKIVFALMLVLCISFLFKLWVKYKNNQYRREAVIEIKALLMNNDQPLNLFISQVLFVLKQTALQSYNRVEVAALQGDDWLSFLDNSVKGSGINFMSFKTQISDAIYRDTFDENVNFNKEEFSQLTINWIKKHA